MRACAVNGEAITQPLNHDLLERLITQKVEASLQSSSAHTWMAGGGAVPYCKHLESNTEGSFPVWLRAKLIRKKSFLPSWQCVLTKYSNYEMHYKK